MFTTPTKGEDKPGEGRMRMLIIIVEPIFYLVKTTPKSRSKSPK
jgi:hypothetical protein